MKRRIINHRSYKYFSNEAFRKSLLNKLSKEVFPTNDDGLQRFSCINVDVLNKEELNMKNMLGVIKCHL